VGAQQSLIMDFEGMTKDVAHVRSIVERVFQ
jgi:hypothetical protein